MNIFIHYLDKELLDVYYPASRYTEDTIKKVCFSIKVAILLLKEKEHIYIPVSNYFESDLAKKVLECFRDIVDLDYIRLVSSSKTLPSFIKKKRIVYPSLYTQTQIYEEEEKILEKNVPGIWTPRFRSATADIISNWEKNIDNSFWKKLYRYSNYKKISSFEKAMQSIPKKIANKAFVVDNVIPELNLKLVYQYETKEIINKAITKFYINSFLEEYKAVCFKNFFLLPQADDILPDGYDHIDYGIICRKMAEVSYEKESLYSYINKCDNFSLLLLKKKEILNDTLNYKKDRNNNSREVKKMKTFIVHGHDDEAKLALKNYIQNTLKMDEPIILAEKASGGRTIIEKFEKYSEQCNLIFVLLTPDDQYSDNSKCRARQNVIFEMGYFLGKLGRKSGRVILLYKGNLELPNDISGLVYINIDNGIEAAGEEIRREIDDLEK